MKSTSTASRTSTGTTSRSSTVTAKSGERRRGKEDEDFMSKEALERRRDRKLKDDITKMMYRIEMDSIKPSFDVMLTAGLHRGLYHRNFLRKRRSQKSKSIQEDLDTMDTKPYRIRSGGIKADNVESTKFQTDKTKDWKYPHESKLGAAAGRSRGWTAEFRDLSPARRYVMPADSRMSRSQKSQFNYDSDQDTLSRLSSLVLRSSRQSDHDIDTPATLPRSWPIHNPLNAVISVEELPVPHRGSYYVTPRTEDEPGRVRNIGDWRRTTKTVESNGPSRQTDTEVQSLSLREDDLVSLLRNVETADDNEFSLQSILSSRGTSANSPSTNAGNSGSFYVDSTSDDVDQQLSRLLGNPFVRRESNFERAYSTRALENSLPYTPISIVTSPSLRYA